MTTTYDNNEEFNPANYWRDVIANLDGSYEEYKILRDLIVNEGQWEEWFIKNRPYNSMSEYRYDFGDVLDYLDYLHEQALELEDYAFCAALVNKRIYAHWKHDAIIDAELDVIDTTDLDDFLKDIEL